MPFRTLIAAIAVAITLVHPALAHSVKLGTLELTDLWTRATPPKAPTGGGYLTITNHGSEADRLVGVSSPLAGKAEIHEMKVEDGVMTMRQLDHAPEIPANGSVVLAVGSFHIMFMELKEPFVKDGKVPVTLTFEKAGTVETFLHVLPIGAPGPGGDQAHGAHGTESAQ